MTTRSASAAATSLLFGALSDPLSFDLLSTLAGSARDLTRSELARRSGTDPSQLQELLMTLMRAGIVASLPQERWTVPVELVGLLLSMVDGTAPDEVGCRGYRPPADVLLREVTDADWPAVRRVYREGIDTGNSTFETSVPEAAALSAKWLPGQIWVAQVDGDVAGWSSLTAASARECYRGIADTSLYVGTGHRGRGVGKALVHQQVSAADAAGLWTLQASIFPENRASITLHRWAGFRVVGVRRRVGQLDGVWRDTVHLERRSPII